MLLKYCILLPNGGLLEVKSYIIYNWVIKKSRLSAIDKYVHQCGFINHIDRKIKACKQRNQICLYAFLAYSELFYKVYLSVMQQIPLSHWD